MRAKSKPIYSIQAKRAGVKEKTSILALLAFMNEFAGSDFFPTYLQKRF